MVGSRAEKHHSSSVGKNWVMMGFCGGQEVSNTDRQVGGFKSSQHLEGRVRAEAGVVGTTSGRMMLTVSICCTPAMCRALVHVLPTKPHGHETDSCS